MIERWVPLDKGHITTRQNIQLHHVPLADAAKLIRELGRGRALLARGLRQHGPQRHRRPLRRGRSRRGLRPHPLRRRLRALLRPPSGHPGDAAQVEDRLLRLAGRPGDRADPRHRLPPVQRDGERGFEVWVGGGTAIMPRLAHKIYDFVAGRRRLLPAGDRGDRAHLRPPGLAAQEPRPGADQGAARQNRAGGLPGPGRRGAGRRLDRRARLRGRAGAAALRRRRGGAGGGTGRSTARRTATAPSSTSSASATSPPSASRASRRSPSR